MQTYKTVFFDLDHTLWDFTQNCAETLEELYHMYDLEQFGFSSTDANDLAAAVIDWQTNTQEVFKVVNSSMKGAKNNYYEHLAIPYKSKNRPFDHIEELRWHIIRSIVVWLVAAITIFIYVDFVYDNIILAPANDNFFTYKALCNLGHSLFHNEALCMPPVKINFQVTEVNGTFTSAINIAMIGGLILAFPYIFWELWRFIKPALTPKERRYGSGSIFYVSLCFFSGAAFGYYLLAPFTFNFLASFTLGKTGMVQYKPAINDYIDRYKKTLSKGRVFRQIKENWTTLPPEPLL